MAITKHEKRIAKSLGVSVVGLAVLSKAVANDGVVTGWAGGNPGSAKVGLLAKGLIAETRPDAFYGAVITDAGREIVRRARALGW